MLVTPLPGADRGNLLNALQHVHIGAVNARGAGGMHIVRYEAYMRWAFDAVRMLRGQVVSADLEKLVLTRTFWALQAPATGLEYVARLADAELDDRVSVLEAACEDLEAQIARWSRSGVFVVPDTTFYIHHQKVEDLDLRELLGIREEPVHLLIPILVVDELDTLKESKDPWTRWRAQYTIAVIDRFLSDPTAVAVLRQEDFSPLKSGGIPRGQITVELVFDPTGHARLPIGDDELVDRAVAIQALAGRKITMITYDTGQSTRARAAGLRAVKIPRPADGDEPDGDGAQRTGKRAGRARPSPSFGPQSKPA
jgi:PIN domain